VNDDSVENPTADSPYSSGNYPRPSLLPWVLFGVTAGVLVALSIVLVRQVSVERTRADTEAQAHANEVAHAEKSDQALLAANARVQPLQLEVKTLTEERDALAAKVKALEASKVAAVKPLAPPAAIAGAKPPVAAKSAKCGPAKKKKK
jgi:uncharacterized protein YlxW (UPF0749 family)